MSRKVQGPDSTAVRVALWRARHSQIDPKPHLLEDEIGFRLITPDGNWRNAGFNSAQLRCSRLPHWLRAQPSP